LLCSAASRARKAASRESVTAERTAELDAFVIWFCALLGPPARMANAADSRATVAKRCDRGFIGFSKKGCEVEGLSGSRLSPR
jgi:hypothetical protein